MTVQYYLIDDIISIHAPARGATHAIIECIDVMQISIHAPARGATRKFFKLQYSYLFQSTLPRGERQSVLRILFIYGEFQSTLPRGERPITGGNKNGTYYFNPRSREGSDIFVRVAI